MGPKERCWDAQGGIARHGEGIRGMGSADVEDALGTSAEYL